MRGDSKAWQTAEVQAAISLLEGARPERQSGIDSAILELTNARRRVDVTDDPLEWANVSVDLAKLYSMRRSGEEGQNLRSVINYYSEALTVFDQHSQPREWTFCHASLGRAYVDLDVRIGPDRRLMDLAILHCRMALAIVTEKNFSELWHRIHLDLSILHKWHALQSDKSDLKLSEEYYCIAFKAGQDEKTGIRESLRASYDLYITMLLLELEKRFAKHD